MSEPFVVQPQEARSPRDVARDHDDDLQTGRSVAKRGSTPGRDGEREPLPSAVPTRSAERFVACPRGGAAVSSGTAATSPVLSQSDLQRHPSLQQLSGWLEDPTVTDVFVNGADGLFVDRGAGAVRDASWRLDEEDVRALAVALVGLGGRHIDDANPCVDVRLERGVRVHAVLPPVARGGAVISIRVPRAQPLSLADLQRRGGVVDDAGRQALERLVRDRANVLITGAAGSGKTTLLGAMLSCVPPTERIVTIEDVAELRITHPHHVSLESRQPNLEGAGGIDLARLVREALRMRPDRLVVGECRGVEVRELLSALNTGHDGGAGTLHANGLDDVPARLEALGALAGLSDVALARQVRSAIGCVIHLARDRDGTRRVAGVGTPVVCDGHLAMEARPWPD